MLKFTAEYADREMVIDRRGIRIRDGDEDRPGSFWDALTFLYERYRHEEYQDMKRRHNL